MARPDLRAGLRAHLRRLCLRLRGLRPQQLSLENRNILYVTVDTALQGLMMGGIFAFISVFIVRLGATKLETSLLTSLPAIVMALASIPSGQVIQRQRDLVRFTNLVRAFHRGSILLVALLPFFTRRGLVTLIIAIWTVKAITNALLDSSWMAVIAEVIPPRRRAEVNGRRWMILSIVTATATALFGYMLDRLPFPINYQLVFVISFIGGTLGMLFWGKLKIPESITVDETPADQRGVVERLTAYWRSLHVPSFVRYELTATVFRLGFNLPTALYSIYWIRQLEASDLWIGWQTTTNQLALILGYAVWGKVVSRKGYFRPLLICTIGVGLYPVLTALVTSQVWLPLISIVQGFFITGVNLALFDTLLAVCPSNRRPSFLAVNTMLVSLAIFLAPLLGSALADAASIQAVFYVAGGVHVVAALLFWIYKVADIPREMAPS